jgi:hypothetical protein
MMGDRWCQTPCPAHGDGESRALAEEANTPQPPGLFLSFQTAIPYRATLRPGPLSTAPLKRSRLIFGSGRESASVARVSLGGWVAGKAPSRAQSGSNITAK